MSTEEENIIEVVSVEELTNRILQTAPDNLATPDDLKNWIAGEIAMLHNFTQVTMNQVMKSMSNVVVEMATEVDKQITKTVEEKWTEHQSQNSGK